MRRCIEIFPISDLNGNRLSRVRIRWGSGGNYRNRTYNAFAVSLSFLTINTFRYSQGGADIPPRAVLSFLP